MQFPRYIFMNCNSKKFVNKLPVCDTLKFNLTQSTSLLLLMKSLGILKMVPFDLTSNYISVAVNALYTVFYNLLLSDTNVCIKLSKTILYEHALVKSVIYKILPGFMKTSLTDIL